MKPQRTFFKNGHSKKSEFTQYVILIPLSGIQNLFRKIDLWIPAFTGMTQRWDFLCRYCGNFEFHREILRRPFENKIFLCVFCD